MTYDLAIVGAGPAGMTAALYAARKMLKTIVVSTDKGGQLLLTREVENWPGTINISGYELSRSFTQHVEQYEVEQRIGRSVTAIHRTEMGFELTIADDESILAKAMIISSGGRSRRLNVPGEEKFTGRGVSYCATCDAPLFSGKKVAVIGGGNAAFEAVIDLLPIAAEIHVVDVAEGWFADPILHPQVLSAERVHTYQQHRLLEVRGDNLVNSVIIEGQNGKRHELDVNGVFVEIGSIPNTNFLSGLLELNQGGEIVVDEGLSTSLPGIFAAGDVINRRDKQVVISAGQGATAALSAYRWLIEEGRLGARG